MSPAKCSPVVEAAIRTLRDLGARPISQPRSAGTKMATFEIGIGQQIALQRKYQEIYLWTQACCEDAPADLARYLHRRYTANEPRSSALNDKNACRLKVGNPADYWRFETIGELERFVRWLIARSHRPSASSSVTAAHLVTQALHATKGAGIISSHIT